jgi:hypothetical protein
VSRIIHINEQFQAFDQNPGDVRIGCGDSHETIVQADSLRFFRLGGLSPATRRAFHRSYSFMNQKMVEKQNCDIVGTIVRSFARLGEGLERPHFVASPKN